MAPDWIHCNKCFIRYAKDNNVKFYLTSCGHMNCNNCVSQMRLKNNLCLICNMNTEVVQLSNDISEEIQLLFLPLSKTIDKLKQIHMFQESNIINLLKHTYVKYAYAKNLIQKLSAANNELKRNNMRLLATLKSNVSTGSSAKSTPIPGTLSPSFNSFNASLVSPIDKLNISDLKRQAMMRPIPGSAYRQLTQIKNNGVSNSSNNSIQTKIHAVPVHKMTPSIHQISSSSIYKKTGN